MPFTMKPNGAVDTWTTEIGTNILFPQTQKRFGDELKCRGGAPVCAPNFGEAPTDGPYTGIKLPKHGLVRDCHLEDGRKPLENTSVRQWLPQRDEDGVITAGFMFNYPWPHEVWVKAVEELSLAKKGRISLRHQIVVSTDLMDDVFMPCSIGFHPYFATGGGPFSLIYQNREWNGDDLGIDSPFFVPHQFGGCFHLFFSHGDVEIRLKSGYNGFCVWTDSRDYVCVEPVCCVRYEADSASYGISYWTIHPGELLLCECVLTYTPKT